MEFPEIETWLRSVAGKWAPGISVAVFDRSGVRWRRDFGVADAASATSLDTATAFRWFSVTKIVTATAVLMLVDRGLLRVDERIVERLPWFRVQPLDPAPTVEQLLSHTSGLRNPIPVGWVHPPGTTVRGGAALAREIVGRRPKLRGKPGETVRYTNLGFLALEALVEQVVGESFNSWVRREVLGPAGMAQTGFGPEDFAAENLATGHERILHLRTPFLAAAIPGASCLVTGASRGFLTLRPFVIDGMGFGALLGPLTDLVRLGRLHLGDGEIDGTRILSADLVRQMRLRRLAWWAGDGANASWVEHQGAAGGFRSALRLFPAQGVGLAVLANAGGAPVDRIADRFTNSSGLAAPL